MAICISCGFDEDEQLARRLSEWRGLCGPGRCVVNGTAWLVWPMGPKAGQPLGFVTRIEQELIDSLHRAGLEHLLPIPPSSTQM